MRKHFVILILLLSFFFIPKDVFAITDPLSVPNNKFGIHINSENDLESAKNLINSSGGDWGYVTIVITEKERDRDRWQNVFDQMRRMHIIPLVRIATKPVGNIWEKPNHEEINNWVGFLNSLNWVTENRYVIILNEPNLDHEWGGKIDPKAYAKYLREFSTKLKEASSDFYVLPAGLAPEKYATKYLTQMIDSDPEIFNLVDGWTSHPYPTESITLYEKELLTINKDLPVFITETGWSGKNFSEDEISARLVNAYQTIWNRPEIVAITPFILNYPTHPFAEFSWQKSDGTFYKFYDEVKNLPKIRGEPKQIEKGEIVFSVIQPVMLTGSDFVGAILAKNTGQTIWNNQSLLIGIDEPSINIKNIYMNDLEPMRLGLIYFKASGINTEGLTKSDLYLANKANKQISNNVKIEGFSLNVGKVQFRSVFDKIKQLFGQF